MKLQKLKEEVNKEFDKKFNYDDGDALLLNYDEDARPVVKDFIDSIITRSYEEGIKYTIERISLSEGWEETEEYYKDKLIK